MSEIKKLILPAAGMGTRFLPLSKAVNKEFLPLADLPLIFYVVEEARLSGIEEIIFVLNESNKNLIDYFKPNLKLEKILDERGQAECLENLRKAHKSLEGINFSFVLQPRPLGDGDAVLRAEKKVEKGAFAVAFFDDVFLAKTPALAQTAHIFSASQKTVVGLKKTSPEKFSHYGIVKTDKIAHNLYKIKDIVEKPKFNESASDPVRNFISNGADLAVCSRYIFNEEILRYLKKTPANQKGEIILAEALKMMLDDGKVIYGCEIEGEWLECGNTQDWLMSNMLMCLRHEKYGQAMRETAKKAKLF